MSKGKQKKVVKRYEIDSFEKFLNVVTEDNFDRVFIDFAEFVGIYLQICKKMRQDNPDFIGKLNSELAQFKTFAWIDDGKTGFKNFTMTDSRTGEVYEITKPKKSKK